MNETMEVIKKRRSIRSFSDKPIKKEDLEAIVEAALYAPSAGNRQPWHFTVIQDKAIIDELSQKAKEAIAADEKSPYQKMAQSEMFHLYYHAPAVIIISGNEQAGYAQADCSAAAQNMLLAAESLDLGSCWIDLVLFVLRGKESDTWRKRLCIPEGYQPLHSVAVGYKAQANVPVPKRKKDCINYL